MKEDEIIYCVCLTCGVRNHEENNNSSSTGYCVNDHDDWLEYRDVMGLEGASPEPLKRFAHRLGVSVKVAQRLFMDKQIEQFKFVNKTTGYDILSPDGFPIEREGFYYTKKNAWSAFDSWKKRFEGQGYYSSNKGRIPLDQLKAHCTLIPIELEPDED